MFVVWVDKANATLKYVLYVAQEPPISIRYTNNYERALYDTFS